MDRRVLISNLSHPRAFPRDTQTVDIQSSRHGVHFITDEHVYWIPIDPAPAWLSLIDLDRQKARCRQTVAHHRLLAPDVYLETVRVARQRQGLIVEGWGPTVIHAVKMRRLANADRWLNLLETNSLSPDLFAGLARHLLPFYQAEPEQNLASANAQWGAFSHTFEEQLRLSGDYLAVSISHPVYARLRQGVRKLLRLQKANFLEWACTRRLRSSHGRFNLARIFFEPESDRFSVIGGLLETESEPFASPIDDLACLSCEMQGRGHPELASLLIKAFDHYFADLGLQRLLAPFQVLQHLKLAVTYSRNGSCGDCSLAERRHLRMRAKAHFLMALSRVSPPSERPCLILLGGPPGSGKVTMADFLAENHGFSWVSTTDTRRRLAGWLPGQEETKDQRDIFSREWTDRTYLACLRRTEDLLFAGQRIVCEAAFHADLHRKIFIETAKKYGVPVHFVVCGPAESTSEIRGVDGPWEEPSATTASHLYTIKAQGDLTRRCQELVAMLKEVLLQ